MVLILYILFWQSQAIHKGGDHMDVSGIADLVSSVGFPVVCFIMCGWYVKYREDKNDDKYDKLNNQHDEEMKQVINALNNNTIALQRLTDKLEVK